MAEPLLFPDEPPAGRFDPATFDGLLVWAADRGVSDVTVRSRRPIKVELDGVLRDVTRQPVETGVIQALLGRIYGEHGQTRLADGRALDCSYAVEVARDRRVLFRVNVTAVADGTRAGIEMTLRVLPEVPPTMDDVALEPEIRAAALPRDGMVLLCGPTGSGKSTTIAAILREIVERMPVKIVTYEAPIEYRFDRVRGPGLISQSEVPLHIASFADGIRNALRRAPKVIVVGEMRDAETLTQGIVAADTGHAVYSTLHSRSVAETMRRMTVMVDAAERAFRMMALLDVLRLVVVQALLPKAGGGRVAAREWLVFDELVRERLACRPVEQWARLLQGIVRERGRPMDESVRRLRAAGLVADDVAERWLRRVAADLARDGAGEEGGRHVA